MLQATPRTSRLLVGSLLGLLGGLGVAATILAFFGSWWWRLDQLAAYRAQLAVLLLLAAVLYGFNFGRLGGAVFFAAALVNAVIVMPLFLPAPGDAVAGSPELRIVSFNLQAGNDDHDRVMEFLAESDADLIFLAESNVDWEAEVRSAGLPYEIASTVPEANGFGTTLLSRQDVTVEELRFAPELEPVLRVTAFLGGEEITVLGVHPLSPTSKRRAEARDDLLEEVGGLVERHVGPVVVIGDLNASTWSHAFRSLVRRGGLVDSQRGFGFQPTWPSGWGPLMVPVDHALVSPDLAVTDRETGPSLGSNHRSLIVTIGQTG